MAAPVSMCVELGVSSPLIDAVAAAICEHDGGSFESKDDAHRAHWRELAWVALEAIGTHLAPRIELDEEGILIMLAGGKGCLE